MSKVFKEVSVISGKYTNKVGCRCLHGTEHFSEKNLTRRQVCQCLDLLGVKQFTTQYAGFKYEFALWVLCKFMQHFCRI